MFDPRVRVGPSRVEDPFLSPVFLLWAIYGPLSTLTCTKRLRAPHRALEEIFFMRFCKAFYRWGRILELSLRKEKG